MDIIIKWNNDWEGFHFPVLPESLSQTESMNNTSIYIHNKGEANLKGKRSLKSVSWSSFFPAQNYRFCKVTPQNPYDYYCKKLKKLMEDNTTVHLIVTDTDINMYCTITQFDHGPGDRTHDVTYTITFQEYRWINGKKRPTKSARERTVKWRKGNTWHKLAKKYLGDSGKWWLLRQKNASVIHKAQKKQRDLKKKNKSYKRKKECDALIGFKVLIRDDEKGNTDKKASRKK